MKKAITKFLSVTLVIAMVLTSSPLAGLVGLELPKWLDFSIESSATDITEGIYTYTVVDGEATITSCDETITGDIIVPSELGGYPVTAIGTGGIAHCYEVASIVLPDSIETIGRSAFSGSRFASLSIGQNVSSIGDYAFSQCDKLESVVIPDSVTSMGDYAFADCLSLKSVVIGNGLTTIEGASFHDCMNLTTLTLGNGVQLIDNMAFEGCYNLKSIVMYNSVTTIGDHSFYPCNALTDIFYVGTEEEWNAIDICDNEDGITGKHSNYGIIDAEKHYNCTWTTVPSTCADQGHTLYECPTCESSHKAYLGYIIPHTEVVDEAVKPTCTETGLTEGSHCSVCNTVLVEQTVVDAIGHKYYTFVTRPTCTTDGFTTHKCLVCDDTQISDEVKATGHTIMIDKAVDPTCTETGLTAGRHCAFCNKATIEQEVVDALGHKYDAVVTAPTCTADGYTTYTCSVCSDTYTADVVTSTGHTEVTDNAVAPTCTETGLTEGSHCSVCNTVLVEQTVVDLLGHKYDSVVTAPTCTADGYTTYICSACSDTYTADVVTATGHTEEILSKVDATCTEDGKTEGSKCSVCNEILVAQQVVTTKGHNFVEEVMKKPTCTETGIEKIVCDECGFIEAVSEIPVIGHTDEDLDGKCDDCKEVVCDCNCHKTGFAKFFWSIGNFFRKLFGNKTPCACGKPH